MPRVIEVCGRSLFAKLVTQVSSGELQKLYVEARTCYTGCRTLLTVYDIEGHYSDCKEEVLRQ